MDVRIRGLDGRVREWAEVFNTNVWETIRHGHGLDSTSGYIVRRTYFDREQAHEDVAFLGASRYGEALTLARKVRVEQDGAGYAVIDRWYDCGCRGAG